MALELVMFTPVLLGAILAIIGASRLVEATDQVSSAAYAAARSASLSAGSADARRMASTAGRDQLADRGLACVTLRVSADVSRFTRGGSVHVQVTCTADLSDVVGFGLPGHKTFTSDAVVPLDVHRDL